MITGAHVLIHSTDAAADRAFFRDVLGFRHVDAGDGWLIFALPPSELALHPDEANGKHEVMLMCDDLEGTVRDLRMRKVLVDAPLETDWGYVVNITLPGGGTLGLYQPKHRLAHGG